MLTYLLIAGAVGAVVYLIGDAMLDAKRREYDELRAKRAAIRKECRTMGREIQIIGRRRKKYRVN